MTSLLAFLRSLRRRAVVTFPPGVVLVPATITLRGNVVVRGSAQ